MKKPSMQILLLCIIFQFTAAGQVDFAPAYQINTDTVAVQNIPNQYWQVLGDKEGEWTIQQVQTAPIANAFRHVQHFEINYATPVSWFRFRLYNATNRELEVGLFGKNERVDYYLQYSNRRWEHKVAGWAIPWSKRDGIKKWDYIPVSIKPGEEIIVHKRVYNSFRFFAFTDYTVTLGFTTKLMRQQYVETETEYFSTIHNSFNFGFLFFAALFTLFFFLIVREKVYLYFAIYVFLLGAGRSTHEIYNLFFSEHPLIWAHLMFYGAWMFTIIFQTLFIRHLLRTYALVPRLDKFLFLLTWFNIFLIPVFYLLMPFSTGMRLFFVSITFTSQVAIVVTALIAFFLALRKQKWMNNILAFAIFPAFCVWGLLWSLDRVLFMLTFILELIPLWQFSQWLFNNWYLIETICLGWQVLFFSWLLLQRFNEQRRQLAQLALDKEKERSELINRQKTELEQQVAERTAELNHSLQELKATQSQLVQQEKMASLGELTAGIAHEIQNPLNFVNNFSDVNKELLLELKAEIDKGNISEVKSIADDLIDNQDKINHHGKRADSIVKGMLQHSRASTGKKEPTDINALADEYLRLAFHGLRAKDKDFNAILKTEFDESIGTIEVAPQDIGRVLLNLYNNAFYAVNEKKKQLNGTFEPTVSVITRRVANKLQISVIDNGTGIPQKAIDKIFQPFFTTKPTGQGTGLGLSLSYDIIKAHGGDLTVETREGEGSEFIIRIVLLKS